MTSILGWEVNKGGIAPLWSSHDQFNRATNGLHFVVTMTRTDRGLRYHVPVDAPEGGLTTRSVIMCEQAKSVSIELFRRYRGQLAPSTVERVQAIVAAFLDHQTPIFHDSTTQIAYN